MPNSLTIAALEMLSAGLSACPAILADKFPTGIAWGRFQLQRMHPTEIDRYFNGVDAICVICGESSGNLEVIDFDDRGSCFAEWVERIDSDLFDLLVVEKSPSGGYHVFYRCEEIAGNQKLAKKVIVCEGPEEVDVDGKRLKPRHRGGRWIVEPVLIETRGRGGLVVCAPTSGYELVQGGFRLVPSITIEQRESLLWAARSFDQAAAVPSPALAGGESDSDTPWGAYNERGDFRDVLSRAGWVKVRDPVSGDDNERWRRPGKEEGHSATINSSRVFYCWSGNAAPFEESKAYSPFQVYMLLEHGGDLKAAAAELSRQGFGAPSGPQPDITGVLKQRVSTACEEPDGDLSLSDNVSGMPSDLLNPDGFLSDVVAYTLATSLYQQPEIALAGAIALLSVLTGRRVRDAKNTRTNIYLLTVNPARSGKDRPREVNKEILHGANGGDMLGPERIGSHAGLITWVDSAGAILFQIDELGRLLATCRDARTAPHLYNIGTVLLTLYSSATNIWRADAYAEKKKTKTIDQPHCVVLGTTTADTLWPNLSRDNVADGLIGRLLIFEGRGYVDFNEQCQMARVPQPILQTARTWVEFKPGSGNLESFHPTPQVIPHTSGADRMYLDHVREINGRRRGETDFRAAVWSGTAEKTAKLALLHACSREYGVPHQITERDVEWGKKLANYLTRRMLMNCSESLSENDTHAKYQKVLKIVGDRKVGRSELCRKLQFMKGRERNDLIHDLLETGQLSFDTETTGGRSRMLYFRPDKLKQAR
jgi:hypothetical protein